MIGKRLINTGVAAAAGGFVPSEHFETVTYTGNGGTQRIGGYINRGGVFNGSSSYIDAPLMSLFGGKNTNTISLWFKSTGTGIYALHSDYGGTSFNNNIFLNYPSTGNIRFATRYGGVDTNIDATSTNYNDGSWHHLVSVVNIATLTKTAYIDGQPIGSGASLSSNAYNGTNAKSTIGAEFNPSNSTYQLHTNGSIDQVRIFNKALSSGEVTTLYGETYASSTVSTTDIFDDNSAIALYQLDGNANDTGGSFGSLVSSPKIDLDVDGYTSGSVSDLSGNGNVATLNGNVIYGTDPNGGGYFKLDGASDYLQISASTDFNSATNFTLEGWFKPNNLTATDHLFTIYDLQTSTDRKFVLRLNDADGDLDFTSYANNGSAAVVLITSNTSVRVIANQWNHIALSYTNNGTVEAFINGKSAGSTTASASVNTSGVGDLYIGVLNDYIGSYDFDGKVGDIRFYDSALSSSQIVQNFNASKGEYGVGFDGTATNVTYQEATKFQPDFVWIKNRGTTTFHALVNSVVGENYIQYSNSTLAGETNSNILTSLDSNGFTVGSELTSNGSGSNYVAWCFKGGGSAVSNTDGTITSTVSANQDAGFSIVSTQSNGSGYLNFGHGLSQAPELVITKFTSQVGEWYTYTTAISNGFDAALKLNGTDAAITAYGTNKWSATSTVVAIGTSQWYMTANVPFICYCFHSVEGFSKIGSYTGVGSGNTVNVVTGFEPAFIMIKRTDSIEDWKIIDNERANFANSLEVNEAIAEEVGNNSNFVLNSNGFTIGDPSGDYNASGGTYIYLAIAADPDTTTPVVENSFDVVTYTGNGTSLDIITDFKPDLVWTKPRSYDDNHQLWDTIRGAGWTVYSNSTNAQNPTIRLDGVSSFNDNGFSIGNWNNINVANETYVAWCWKAGDHDDNLPQINTEGTINSIVSVNAAAGFSIIKFTAPSSGVWTYGHGLSSTPEMIIIKDISAANDWQVFFPSILGNNQKLVLNSTAAAATTGVLNNTNPTSTLITQTGYGNSNNQIAYCFHSVSGYQKIGSFSYSVGHSENVGFEPRFLMMKKTSNISSWYMIDNKRVSGTNNYGILANSSAAEDTGTNYITFTSTGFTTTYSDSGTYIYLAIK